MSDRRLPVYFLLDCSESMIGPPLDEVKWGLDQLCLDLRSDPRTIETVWISVITFAKTAKQVCPLTEILKFTPPALNVGPGTNLGAALDQLGRCISGEVQRGTPTQKGDRPPIIFLLTDGTPTDNWKDALDRFLAQHRVQIVALGCGEDVDRSVLDQIASTVVLLRDATPGDLRKFFKWVSQSISAAAGGDKLPPVKPAERDGLEAPAPRPATPSQVILAAHCSKDRNKGYLMRYRRAKARPGRYEGEGAYRVGNDYFGELTGAPAGQTVGTDKLTNHPACPYCGQPGWHWASDERGLVCGFKKAQVMFVLDATYSMRDEIDEIRENIGQFVDRIARQEHAVEVRLIAFRDVMLERPQRPDPKSFAGRPFTRDAKVFKHELMDLKNWGGGDNKGESCFDAMVLACRQPFDQSAERILIVITDDHPHLPDGEVRSIEDVIGALKRAGIGQLHFVIPEKKRRGYDPLLKHVKLGKVFLMNKKGHSNLNIHEVLMAVGDAVRAQMG